MVWAGPGLRAPRQHRGTRWRKHAFGELWAPPFALVPRLRRKTGGPAPAQTSLVAHIGTNTAHRRWAVGYELYGLPILRQSRLARENKIGYSGAPEIENIRQIN